MTGIKLDGWSGNRPRTDILYNMSFSINNTAPLRIGAPSTGSEGKLWRESADEIASSTLSSSSRIPVHTDLFQYTDPQLNSVMYNPGASGSLLRRSGLYGPGTIPETAVSAIAIQAETVQAYRQYLQKQGVCFDASHGK